MNKEIIEIIETRIRTRQFIVNVNRKLIPYNEREGGIIDTEINMSEDEIEFLNELLKEMKECM